MPMAGSGERGAWCSKYKLRFIRGTNIVKEKGSTTGFTQAEIESWAAGNCGIGDFVALDGDSGRLLNTPDFNGAGCKYCGNVDIKEICNTKDAKK